MRDKIRGRSQKPGERTGRSRISAAVPYALRVGLRILFLAGALACGSPWTRGDAQEISRRNGARDVPSSFTHHALSRRVSGSHDGGAAPGSDFFPRFGQKLSPYFRVCTCNMIIPIPIKIPGDGTACATACKCDDGAFGIGLHATRHLVPFCSIASETICPWQIKTISPSSPVGLSLPVQFAVSQIVGCRLLESRPWE